MNSINAGCRKYKDKHVPYKLTVAAKEIKLQSQTFVTNHWLTWEQFTQIHTILDEIINENFAKYKSSRPEPQWQRPISRYLPNCSVKLHVTVEKRESELLKLLQLDERDTHKLQFTIKVSDDFVSKEKVEKVVVVVENGESTPLNSQESPVLSFNEIYTPESYETTSALVISPPYKPSTSVKSKEKHHKNVQEYVPKASSSSSYMASSKSYVPTKIKSQSDDASNPIAEDEYCPEVVSVADSQESETEKECKIKGPKSQKYTPTTITRKSPRKTCKQVNHTKNSDHSEDLENDELEDIGDVITPALSRKRQLCATPLPSSNTSEKTPSDQEGDTPIQKGVVDKYIATPTSRKTKMSKLSFSSQESLSNVTFTNEKQKSDTQSSRNSCDLFGSDTSDSESERKPKPAIKNLFEKYNVDVEPLKVDTDPTAQMDIDFTTITDDDVKADDKKKSKTTTTSKSSKKKEKENSEREKAKGGNMMHTWLGRNSGSEDGSKKPVASTSGKPAAKVPKIKIYKHSKPTKANREAVTNMEKQREKMLVTRMQLDDIQSNFNMNATQEPVELLTCKSLDFDLLDTFIDYKDLLLDLMKEYKDYVNFKKIQIFDNLTPADINAHCTSDQTYQMVLTITRKLNAPSDSGRYDSLFTEVLLPEWVVQLFMKKHKMCREDSLKYMERQKHLLCNEDLELSYM